MPRLPYHQTLNPFAGLAESIVTGNAVFYGDAAYVSFSLVTSSATASRWTLLGYEGESAFDGFQTALPTVDANNWLPVKVLTSTGFGSLDTLPRWGVWQRTPSASSTTLRVTIHVGL